MQEQHNRKETYIIGLFLSKFDEAALIELKCKTWKEAYIKISDSLGCKDTTIKQIRDWFDPFFPNKRQGWHKNKPHKMVRDVLNEFRNYELKDLKSLVEKILEDELLSNLQSSNNLTIHLSHTKRKQLIKTVAIEKQQKLKERNQDELEYLLKLWKQEGGRREVPIFDCKSLSLVGIADLITDTQVIEVKDIKNFKHAIGQIYAYWYYFSLGRDSNIYRLIPRIHLFGGNGINDYRVQLCQSLMKKVFKPYKVSAVVTYAK
ncbi:hypothetical protein NIES4071_68930 [Calothrix sp. NIES-4071]|nr:hypothetical protein NIES4071_68930 [Calothrix sp. NIES-4071]BAZ61171.1 hypothetical protein NIES4105_68890 [Calothrix sp. NIES-4105]